MTKFVHNRVLPLFELVADFNYRKTAGAILLQVLDAFFDLMVNIPVTVKARGERYVPAWVRLSSAHMEISQTDESKCDRCSATKT